MGSTRAEGRVVGAVPTVDADLVKAAAALRWARPDLTAELADHVLEEASAADQQELWLAAAGWAVHARASTGDGRATAHAVLAALTRWGSDALAGAAAHRLRIELALVAAVAGEVESARRLLAGVVAADDPELTADLLCAHARCAVEDAPDEVAAALDAAVTAWAMVGGRSAELGGASVALVRAVVERRAGRPAAAVEHAADGLARLERGRAGSGTPSGHLAAALAAEWISALLDAGRVAEARDGCGALLPRLAERARPTRQLALLRLTVTRALAAQDAGADTAELLTQAADDAAGSDVPDLEAVCRTALGALHEQAGRLDVALAALQLAVEAERRDRGRSRRFLAALAELPVEQPQLQRHRERAGTGDSHHVGRTNGATSAETTTILPAITRGDRKLKSNRQEEHERAGRGADDRAHDDTDAGGTHAAERGRSRFERLFDEIPPVEAGSPAEAEAAAADEPPTEWDAVPWSGSAGDSPIGDLLIRSLRDGSTEPSGNGAARRNGKTVGGPETHAHEPSPGAGNGAGNGRAPGIDSGEPAAGAARGRAGERRDAERSEASSGWVPTLDEDRAGEGRSQTRRRGRFSDADRRRPAGSRRAREERDEAAPAAPRHSEPIQQPDDDPQPITDTANGVGSSRAQERPGRSRRRSRDADTNGAGGVGDRPARGRHGTPVAPDDLDGAAGDRSALASDEPASARASRRSRREAGTQRDLGEGEGRRSRGARSGRGARPPVEEPATVDRWSPQPDAHDEEVQVPAGEAAPSEASPAIVDDSDGWLQAALADLDRALSGIGVNGSGRTEEPPPADGCAVVVDIARDGRRFAGPRAAAVVRAVADMLADHLPAGAQTRFGDADALVITGAGWSRADATDWMHRTLPGMLDGFVAAEEFPGAQLRVAVHDADGTVGAQILQPLMPAGRERDTGDDRHRSDGDPWVARTAHTSEARGQQYRAAARASRPERGARRRDADAESAEPPAGDVDSPRWPFSGEAEQSGPEAPPDGAGFGSDDVPGSANGHGGGSPRAREPGETSGRESNTGSSGRHGADRGRSAGDRGRRHRTVAPERREPAGPGRAGRRRNGEVSSNPGTTDNGSNGNGSNGNGAAGSPSPETGGSGRRARRDGGAAAGAATAVEQVTAPEGDQGASDREPERPESTEGLGIADLLAGALAAYRGI